MNQRDILNKLVEKLKNNKETAIKKHYASEINKGSINMNGLFIVLWKNKYACIVNAKGDLAAKISFDDLGRI